MGQVMSAGVERVLHLSGGNDLRDSNIVLTNNQIVQGPEIADHALALLLTLSRGINTFIANKQQELWQARPYGGIELNGRNAVVIGVGGIGTQIAVRASAFGMNVTGVDPEDIPFSSVSQKSCETGSDQRSSAHSRCRLRVRSTYPQEPQNAWARNNSS